MTDKKRQRTSAKKTKRTPDNIRDEKLSLAALDAIEELVHVVDPELRIQVINRRFREWCRQLGVDTGNVIGATVFDVFGFLPERVRDEYRRVFETGKEVTTEESIRINDRDIYTRTKKFPVSSGGKVTHVVTIVSDITDYSETRKELRTSAEHYGQIMENIPVSVAVIDGDGVYLYLNRHSAKNLGAKPHEVLGSTLHDYFPPDLADQHLGNIRHVIANNTNFTETVRTFRNEKWAWYDVSIQPFAGMDGNIVAALVIANEITSYKEAIDALRESEERFRRQFQASPLPTYIWEHRKGDFFLTAFNQAASVITNGKIEEFVGETVKEMYSMVPEIIEDMRSCLRQKKTIQKEMAYYFRSTGDERFLIVYYVYVPPNQVLVHTEDITERRRSRDELQKAHDELERRVRERTEELASINETLRVERESLRQKNIALNEVLAQIEQGKRQLGMQIQSNINRIALPILKSLENRVDASGAQYIELLRSNLKDIAAPLSSELEKRFADLTPRELEICHMIRNGLNCKEIADTFNTALQTVLKQRSAIRKKLGIANKKVNLETFLKSF